MDVTIKVEPQNDNTDVRFVNGETEVEIGISGNFDEFPVDIDFPHDEVAKRYSCLVCNKQFDSKALLDSHVVYSECGGSAPPVYICKLCEQHFTSRQNLQEHVFVHTGADSSEAEDYVINCQNCNRGFGHSTELALHIRFGDCTQPWTLHNSNQQESQLIATPPENIINPAINQPALLFLQQENALTAEEAEKEKCRHRCHQCGEDFSDIADLERHQVIHTRYKRIAPKNAPSQPIINIWFSESTENASQLGSSEEKSSEIYKFVCEFCYKNFKHSRHLRDHVIARHTKDYSQFRHVCELCKKNFRSPKDLSRHLMVHQKRAQREEARQDRRSKSGSS